MITSDRLVWKNETLLARNKLHPTRNINTRLKMNIA